MRRLAADAAVVSDMRIWGPDEPALTESLRGALSLELTCRGPKTDLHSGNFGGAIENPLQVLCAIVAGLQDATRPDRDPGLLRSRARCSGARARRDGRRRSVGSRHPRRRRARCGAGANQGIPLYERTTVRPALTVTAIRGGYQGGGVKAVVPARASAMLDFRLAADQDPAEIDRLCRRFVARIVPPSATVTVRTLFSAPPVSTPRASTAVQAAAPHISAAFGRAPAFLRIGGTIPVVHLLERMLRRPHGDDGLRAAGQQPARAGREPAPADVLSRHPHEPPFSARNGGERCVMIIDCHCHAGMGDGLTGPWDTAAPLGRHLRRAARAGIGRTVIFAAFHSDYASANRDVARMVASRPDRLYGFAFVNAERDRGRVHALVRVAVQEYGFMGIKVHRHDARITREVCEAARAFGFRCCTT